MVQDPEGHDQSSGYDMTSLQTVPCHIAGNGGIVLLEKKNCFHQSDRLARHVGGILHPHTTGL